MVEARNKILCIEDDFDTATSLAELLTDRGFDVNVAHDGQEGVGAILRTTPNLVLCHLGEPELSGFELLERLVAFAPRFRHIPFVFLTTLAVPDGEFNGRRLGVGDYVTRPIDVDWLFTVIAARLAPVPGGKNAPKPLTLSEREAEMLTWAARGKTSAEIAELVGLTKRTIDFHIDNARIKLGAKTRIEAAIKAVSVRLIRP